MEGGVRRRLEDHPLRHPLANELHARPFPTVSAPCHAAFLAIKQPSDAASRDRALDAAHLTALLDRFGAPHPQPGATHWFGALGRNRLKWETHTEFVTYTLFAEGVAERPFDPRAFEAFPEDWLARAPGVRITSALVRVERRPDEERCAARSPSGSWPRASPRAGSWTTARRSRATSASTPAGTSASPSSPTLRSASAASGASSSDCARSRPTRRCRCWGWRACARWAARWPRSTAS